MRRHVAYVSGNSTPVSSVKTRAAGSIASSMSRITDASFWNEQATYRRGWNSSTTWARTSCALRDSRSVGAARTAAQVSPLLGCHRSEHVHLRGATGGLPGGGHAGERRDNEHDDQRDDRNG